MAVTLYPNQADRVCFLRLNAHRPTPRIIEEAKQYDVTHLAVHHWRLSPVLERHRISSVLLFELRKRCSVRVLQSEKS